MTVRSILPLVAALISLAAPAAAQQAAPPPEPAAPGADAAPDADAESEAVDEPSSDLTPAELAAVAEGEVIEIAGPPALVPVQVSGETMSREEIRALPGGRGDAVEVVRSMPGVAFAPAFDGGAGDLAIRGTRGADSLYLVDGIPVPQAMHFGNLTAIMPPEMIESIELLPGGFDVEHGRATGGVVEIRTRRPRVDRWGGAAEISFVHASAFAQGPILGDELAVAASFRRSFIDLFLPALIDDADLSLSTPPSYTDAQVRLDWTPGYRNEVSLVGLYSDDAFGIDLGLDNPNDPLLTGQIGTSDSFWRAMATWRYDGARVGSRAAVSYGGAVEKLRLNETHFLDSRPDELMAREDLRIDVTDWLRLRAGADLRVLPWEVSVRMPPPPGEGRPDPLFTTSPTIELDQDETQVEAGGYLAADVRPIERLSVTPGVRIDHFQHIDATIPQPRIAAELRLGAGWSTKGSIGRFTRPNSLVEAIPEDLEAEKAIQATAGVEQRITPGIRASVTGFQTWLRDLAVYSPTPMNEDPIADYRSTGEGEVRGLEVMARAQRDELFAWLAYTYTRSRRTDAPGMPERRFDYDQPHNVVAAASWRLGKWTLGGRFRYASGTLTTPVVGSTYLADQDLYQPIYGPTNSERLEASHQLDLRVDRRFPFDGWELSAYLDVSNAYANARVIDYTYEFDYSEREAFTDLPILPSIGVRGAF